jgi:hypothetical protein
VGGGGQTQWRKLDLNLLSVILFAVLVHCSVFCDKLYGQERHIPNEVRHAIADIMLLASDDVANIGGCKVPTITFRPFVINSEYHLRLLQLREGGLRSMEYRYCPDSIEYVETACGVDLAGEFPRVDTMARKVIRFYPDCIIIRLRTGERSYTTDRIPMVWKDRALKVGVDLKNGIIVAEWSRDSIKVLYSHIDWRKELLIKRDGNRIDELSVYSTYNGNLSVVPDIGNERKLQFSLYRDEPAEAIYDSSACRLRLTGRESGIVAEDRTKCDLRIIRDMFGTITVKSSGGTLLVAYERGNE